MHESWFALEDAISRHCKQWLEEGKQIKTVTIAEWKKTAGAVKPQIKNKIKNVM